MKLSLMTMKILFALMLTAILAGGCEKPDPQLAADAAMAQCNLCASRLRQIDEAKQAWADANGKTTNDTPTPDDLAAMMRVKPHCPSGGTYTITPVGQKSTCSIPEHTEFYKTNVVNR